MKIIKTKTFELAINTSGDINSERIAIALPGRLDTKDYISFDSHINYLARKGFFALSFDPPGTWESPGKISLYTTTNYIKAVNEIIEYFGNRPTFLIGHSRGGTVSVIVGTSNKNVISFAPIMATYGEPTSPELIATKSGIKISSRDLPPGSSRTKEQKIFPLPMSYFEDGKKYDNIVDVLKKCTKPKLIFYGTRDKFTSGEKVKEIFLTIQEPKMIHELNTDHDYRLHPEIIDEINKVVVHFLDTYHLI